VRSDIQSAELALSRTLKAGRSELFALKWKSNETQPKPKQH